MAFITTNAPLTAARPASGFFAGLIGQFNAWRMYRKTVAELSSLTDRELDDIGITRGSISHYARQGK